MFFPKLWFKSEEMMAENFREFFNVYRNIYIYDLVYLGKPQCICNIRLIYLKTFINYFKLYLKNSKNVS